MSHHNGFIDDIDLAFLNQFMNVPFDDGSFTTFLYNQKNSEIGKKSIENFQMADVLDDSDDLSYLDSCDADDEDSVAEPMDDEIRERDTVDAENSEFLPTDDEDSGHASSLDVPLASVCPPDTVPQDLRVSPTGMVYQDDTVVHDVTVSQVGTGYQDDVKPQHSTVPQGITVHHDSTVPWVDTVTQGDVPLQYTTVLQGNTVHHCDTVPQVGTVPQGQDATVPQYGFSPPTNTVLQDSSLPHLITVADAPQQNLQPFLTYLLSRPQPQVPQKLDGKLRYHTLQPVHRRVHQQNDISASYFPSQGAPSHYQNGPVYNVQEPCLNYPTTVTCQSYSSPEYLNYTRYSPPTQFSDGYQRMQRPEVGWNRHQNMQMQQEPPPPEVMPFSSCLAGKLTPKRLPQRQPSEQAMLLDLNRCKYGRWQSAVEFTRRYLGKRHNIFLFICELLDASEKSNYFIQWLTKTQTMQFSRAFEFKNTHELIDKYNRKYGGNMSYKSFSNMLSLKEWKEGGAVVIRKVGKSQRNKYVLLPDMADNDLGSLGRSKIDFNASGHIVETFVM